MTSKTQKNSRPAIIIRAVAVVSISALALAAPASADSSCRGGGAGSRSQTHKAPTLQNDTNANTQLFTAPNSIDAWRLAFPS